MVDTKISNRQLGFILFMMRSTIIIAFLPVLTSADALQDAWISAIITLIFSLIFTAFIVYLSKKFPGKTVIEYSQILLGKWLGKLIGLVFLWLFLQLSAVETRIYGEVINIDFLLSTPLVVIMGVMIFTASICAYQGLEVLGRSADFLFLIFLLMILVLLFIPLLDFEISNIQPVFARGWGPIVRGSLVPIALISQVWVIGVLAPEINDNKKILKTSFIAIGLSIAVLVIFSFLTIGTIGPYEGRRSVYPIFTLIRSIEISQFLQRAEVLIIFAWGMGHFITISCYLYAGAKSLSQWLGVQDYKPLIWPMAIIWVLVTKDGFESMFILNKFLSPEIYAPYGIIILFIPLLLLFLGYLLYKIKKR